MKKFFAIPVLFLALSFTLLPGGEGYRITAGKTELVARYGNEMNQVASLQLQALPSPDLYITYYHCGQPGHNRLLKLVDQNNKVVRSFNYPDAKTATSVMQLNAASIPVSNGNELQLVYSSKELPNGRVLAKILP